LEAPGVAVNEKLWYCPTCIRENVSCVCAINHVSHKTGNTIDKIVDKWESMRDTVNHRGLSY
jgi:hypothetical protein